MTGDIEFLEPWFTTGNPEFVGELRRELPPGHVLFGVSVSAVARRYDRDEVLFALDDGSGRVAAVHLTYAREAQPTWPSTRLFDSLEAWTESMKLEHDEFGA